MDLALILCPALVAIVVLAGVLPQVPPRPRPRERTTRPVPPPRGRPRKRRR